MTSRREKSYQYKESGLDTVYLLNAVTTQTCRTCGPRLFTLPMVGLHAAIAAALACKPQRLAPEEARFLRKAIGWAAGAYAARIGATPETVSRWENGKTPMGPQAERLLRLMAVHVLMIPGYSLVKIEDGHGIAQPTRLEFEHSAKGWAERKAGALGGRPRKRE